MHVEQIRLHAADDPGHFPVVHRKIVAVAAIEPAAPAGQGKAKVLHPLAHLVVRQFRVRDPDDHRLPVLQASRRLFDKQLRGAAPDGRDGIEFGTDEGYRRHLSFEFRVSSFRPSWQNI